LIKENNEQDGEGKIARAAENGKPCGLPHRIIINKGEGDDQFCCKSQPDNCPVGRKIARDNIVSDTEKNHSDHEESEKDQGQEIIRYRMGSEKHFDGQIIKANTDEADAYVPERIQEKHLPPEIVTDFSHHVTIFAWENYLRINFIHNEVVIHRPFYFRPRSRRQPSAPLIPFS